MPAFAAARTLRSISASTAGCSGSKRCATRSLPRSTASVYCVRSLVPMLKKSHSRASASAISAADGTSIMMPIGSSRVEGDARARASSAFDLLDELARACAARRATRSSAAAAARCRRRSRAASRAAARGTTSSCVEREADRAAAELRVLLGAVREARPDPCRRRGRACGSSRAAARARASTLLVELRLLLLLGEAAMREHQQLGAEQADAVGAVLLDRGAGRRPGRRWR